MKIKTEKKEIDLIIKTKGIIEITDNHPNENIHNLFFEKAKACDVKFLSELLKEFSYNNNEKAFKDIDEVYTFIDDYANTNELYEKIGESISEAGFFQKKLSLKEIKEEMQYTTNLDNLISEQIEKIVVEELYPMMKEEAIKGMSQVQKNKKD